MEKEKVVYYEDEERIHDLKEQISDLEVENCNLKLEIFFREI